VYDPVLRSWVFVFGLSREEIKDASRLVVSMLMCESPAQSLLLVSRPAWVQVEGNGADVHEI